MKKNTIIDENTDVIFRKDKKLSNGQPLSFNLDVVFFKLKCFKS